MHAACFKNQAASARTGMVYFLYIANCIIHRVKQVYVFPGLLACHFLFTYIAMPNFVTIVVTRLGMYCEYVH